MPATDRSVTSKKHIVVQQVTGASGIQIGKDRGMFHDQPIAENAGSKSATLKHSSLFSEGEKVPANNGSGVHEVGQGSIIVMSQHRPVVNAIVVPVTAAINRVASDLKDATGSVLDRGSAGASKGLNISWTRAN